MSRDFAGMISGEYLYRFYTQALRFTGISEVRYAICNYGFSASMSLSLFLLYLVLSKNNATRCWWWGNLPLHDELNLLFVRSTFNLVFCVRRRGTSLEFGLCKNYPSRFLLPLSHFISPKFILSPYESKE